MSKPSKSTPTPRPKVSRVEVGLAAASAAFVPIGVYVTSHKAMAMGTTSSIPLWILSVAGLIYSIPSVAAWAKSWTSCKWKAYGFTIMLEGIMVLSGEMWLSIISLALLAGVNAKIASAKVENMTKSTFKVPVTSPTKKPKVAKGQRLQLVPIK